eukprot:8611918-Alexandrium_andersonii.AAC.1
MVVASASMAAEVKYRIQEAEPDARHGGGEIQPHAPFQVRSISNKVPMQDAMRYVRRRGAGC